MTPYTETQMREAFNSPIKSAEAVSNLAQTYNEAYQKLQERADTVDLQKLHAINSQIIALAVSNGEQIYLAAMLASIQRQQAKLDAAMLQSQTDLATSTANVSNLRLVETHNLHGEPDAAQ